MYQTHPKLPASESYKLQPLRFASRRTSRSRRLHRRRRVHTIVVRHRISGTATA